MNKTKTALAVTLLAAILNSNIGAPVFGKQARSKSISTAPMNMNGAVSMNGRPYDMQCDMQPLGKNHGTTMSLDKPMKLHGTMTLNEQNYDCKMSIVPKQLSPIGQNGQSKPMSDQEIRKEFVEADKNHDGLIDLNEMVAHEGGDKNIGKLHFNDADANKDGRVDEAEWIRHHKDSALHMTNMAH